VTAAAERNAVAHAGWAVAALCLALAALKLWLTSAQPLVAIAPNYVDDSGFLRQALRIANGEGLGAYDVTTLIKGPGYPIFVALAYRLGVPLLLAQHALYAAACAAFAFAARHWIASPAARGALFALLLWNPMTFEEDLLRPLREGVYPAQLLLVAAAAIETAAARNRSLARLAFAAGALGAALAWLWLTREEGIAILPAAAIAGAALAIAIIRERPPRTLARGAAVALAVLVPLAAVAGCSGSNARHYGVPAVVELKTREVRAACGALLRAAGEAADPLVPLPRAARARLYAVSPSFRELERGFEGFLGDRWAAASHVMLPGPDGEITGGWWIWALRSVASEAGWHETGAGALAHYARLADEVNAACDAGLIPCGPPHDSLAPRLSGADARPILRSFARAVGYVVRFPDVVVRPRPSRAPPDELALFARATHMRLSDLRGAPARPKPPQYVLRLRWLGRVGAAYAWLVPALTLAAAAALAWRGRRFPVSLQVAFAALLALLLARLALVAVLDAASFPAVNPLHLAPAFPIWLAIVGTAIAAAAAPARPETRSGAVPSSRAASVVSETAA
jgi:hypothetical protein